MYLYVPNPSQGSGTMPDGTTRVTAKGQSVYQIASIGSFAEYAVFAENSTAKVRPTSTLHLLCFSSAAFLHIRFRLKGSSWFIS